MRREKAPAGFREIDITFAGSLAQRLHLNACGLRERFKEEKQGLSQLQQRSEMPTCGRTAARGQPPCQKRVREEVP